MRKFIIAGLLLVALGLQAQVPQWRIHPKYASIEILGNGLYMVSNNGKYGLLNAQEQEILPLEYDRIEPFEAHYALLYNNNKPVAYVSDKGVLKDISDQGFEVIGEPRFFNGYLLVKNDIGYFYLRAEDCKAFGPYNGGTPFSEGFAAVRIPKNPKKILDGDFIPAMLSAATAAEEKLNLDKFDADDVDFISSVSNGKSVISLKKHLYEYDFRKGSLTPMHTDGNTANKKSRVTANERPCKVLSEQDGFSILTKQGKLTFDPRMRLSGILYTGMDPKTVEVPQEIVEEKTSAIHAAAESGGLFGLAFNDTDILTPQFNEVSQAWNEEVIVKQKGKYGIIYVDPRYSCRFSLNDNSAIGFAHRAINTTIKAVCPPYMKMALMKLSSLDDDNCHINTDTRRENVNVESAVLSYDCSINIPEEIGLERKPSFATFALTYDGLTMTPRKISYDTWYINNYAVQILKHQTEGKELTAEILVSNRSADGNYFKDVVIEAEDSIPATLTKITEEQYTAKFFNLKTSNVRFSIDVTEDGCPTITYDFSLPTGIVTAQQSQEPVQEKTVSQGKIKKKASKRREEKKQPVIFRPN